MYFLQVVRDLAFVLAVVLVGLGICGIILWMSTKNTMSREARVEITTSIVDAIYYAGWQTSLFFSNMNKAALVRRSVYLLIATAVLAAVTDGLNRGTITWWGIALTTGVAIAVALALLFFCIIKEHDEHRWRKC